MYIYNVLNVTYISKYSIKETGEIIIKESYYKGYCSLQTSTRGRRILSGWVLLW